MRVLPRMGKYSSDSDSDRNSRKSRRDRKSNRRRYSRSRSSSTSDSSTSQSRKSHSQYKSRGHRSSSTERHRSGRDRHGKYRRDKKHRHRRSRSRSYITEFTSTRRRSSSSSSNSGSSNKKPSKQAPTKQILPSRPNADIEPIAQQHRIIESEVINIPDEVIQELNENSFEPKEFASKSKETIVIDLQKQIIKVPQADAKKSEADNIFHHSLFQPEEVRMVKWLKELYSYRHRALQTGGNKI